MLEYLLDPNTSKKIIINTKNHTYWVCEYRETCNTVREPISPIPEPKSTTILCLAKLYVYARVCWFMHFMVIETWKYVKYSCKLHENTLNYVIFEGNFKYGRPITPLRNDHCIMQQAIMFRTVLVSSGGYWAALVKLAVEKGLWEPVICSHLLNLF